jgi:cell division protein FtsL
MEIKYEWTYVTAIGSSRYLEATAVSLEKRDCKSADWQRVFSDDIDIGKSNRVTKKSASTSQMRINACQRESRSICLQQIEYKVMICVAHLHQ